MGLKLAKQKDLDLSLTRQDKFRMERALLNQMRDQKLQFGLRLLRQSVRRVAKVATSSPMPMLPHHLCPCYLITYAQATSSPMPMLICHRCKLRETLRFVWSSGGWHGLMPEPQGC